MTGDIIAFADFLADLTNKVHDMDGDTFKGAFVKRTFPASPNLTGVRWGAGGTLDASGAAYAVATGAVYTGPVTLAALSVARNNGALEIKLSADVTVNVDAVNGFEDAGYLLIYNHTDASKRAIGVLDLGGTVSLKAGPITIYRPTTNVILSKPLRIAQVL